MGDTHSKPGSDDAEDNKKQSSSEAPDISLTNEASSSGTASANKPKERSDLDVPDKVFKYSIGEFLTVQEQQKLRGVNLFFMQTIGEDRALNARLACRHVLTGQPEELLKLLSKDPEIFFHPYPEVTFKAAGQVYYNVSPADLVYFLCDDDMWGQVKVFAANLPEEQRTPFFEKWQAQQQAMGKGGADLLYVTGDTPPQYANCFETTDTINVFGDNQSLTRPLLKNPDGIVCWKSPNNQVHLYYANPATKALEPIDVSKDLSDIQRSDYEVFKASMTSMESNTVRRSSNAEHSLFKAILRNRQTHQPIKLTREGIHYKQDGIDYCDTHHDFNRLTNAYLKCIRLYQAARAERNSERRQALRDEANSVWRAELARLQKKVIWLLQRFCEKNRLFYPLPNFNEPPFRRSLMIHNPITDKKELLFDVKTELFLSGFGIDDSNSGFALCKGWSGPIGSLELSVFGDDDLIAENRLTVDATNAVEIPIELPPPVAGLKSSC